jgi:hypothetical protein
MNVDDNAGGETGQDPNQPFYEKAERGLRDLFERAKAAHELHFAMALAPEFRGSQDHGWSTAHESVLAHDQFTALVKQLKPEASIRVRVILAFYNHVAEGAGFTRFRRLCCSQPKGVETLPYRSRTLSSDIAKPARLLPRMPIES